MTEHDRRLADTAGAWLQRSVSWACFAAALSAPLLWPVIGAVPGLVALVPLLRKNRFERLLFYAIYVWVTLILARLRHMD